MKDPRNAVQDLNKNWSLVGKKKNGESQAIAVNANGAIGGVNENDIPNLSSVSGQTVGVTDIFDVVAGTGDIITAEGNTNGSRYIKISQSPFNQGTETTLTSKKSYIMPFYADSGLSISLRLVGVEQAYGVVGVDSSGAIETLPIPSDLAISGNVTVLTNVWTINTTVPHGLVPNDRIVLFGNTDSRLNVGPVLVTSVVSTTQFTITSTLANATYTAGGMIGVADPMSFAVNGANFVADNATPTQMFNSSRTSGNSKYQNAPYTVSTTAISGTPSVRSEGILPTSEYSLEMYPDYNYYTNLAVDSTTALQGLVKRTNQIPDANKEYKVRYRCKNHINFSVPIARIISANKTGTTTATIVTDVPHNLTTSDFVIIQGVRDVANFPNLITGTAVASVIDSTTFTVVQGSAITASTFDGVVFKMNGLGTIANQAGTRGIQQITATSNELTLLLSGTVTTTVLVGDTFNVYGLTPALVAYEGTYVVLDNSGSNIICRPIDASGNPRTIADIGSTATGGMYIRRVDYIIHWTRAKETPRQAVEIIGSDMENDISRAAKVAILGTPPVTISSGIVTSVTTVASVTSSQAANPGLVADIASAAIATTTTTAAVTPAFGTAYSISIPVTAVSGTNPTMDVGIEESDDSGTNWVRVYDFERITATGMFRSPPLIMRGNRMRYVQTIGGTTPSFTRALNRLQSSAIGLNVRQFIDRTIVPNTLNSTTPTYNIEGCDNINVTVNCKAQTTPATLTLEFSDDSTNWFASALTLATAVGIVQAKSTNEQWKFMRIRVSTAGTGIILSSVTTKAKSIS